MAKYSYMIDGESFEEEEVFDTYKEAEEAAYEAISNMMVGAAVLNMSNPGDYEFDEDSYDDMEIEVIVVDD